MAANNVSYGNIMEMYNISDGNNTSSTNSTDISNNITGKSDEEFLDDILDFIFPKFYKWIFLFAFFVVFVIGIGGNFLVCYSVWKSNQLKTVTNFFLVNLAVADFLVILICLPPSIISEVMQSWFLGLIMCKITQYLQNVSVFVSVLTLTSISVERYLAICHPLTYHGTSFKTRLVIFIIWIISLGTPCIVLQNMILKHDSDVPSSLRPWLTKCAPENRNTQKIFQMSLIVVFYLCPLTVMTFTYVKIAVCLWSSTSTGNAVSQSLQYDSAIEQLKIRRRTAKMLIVVVITFGLCFLPIYILNIIRYTNALYSVNDEVQICLFWAARFLCYFNSAVNPVIYNFMSIKFRNQFKTACHGCYSYLSCFFRQKGHRVQRVTTKGVRTPKDNVSNVPLNYPSRTNNIRLTSVATHH